VGATNLRDKMWQTIFLKDVASYVLSQIIFKTPEVQKYAFLQQVKIIITQI
jgi:hypothetical protein